MTNNDNHTFNCSKNQFQIEKFIKIHLKNIYK